MRFLIILFCSFVATSSFSQNKIVGKVVAFEDSTPIQAVVITEAVSKKWAITDKEGSFQMNITNQEEITLVFKVLGRAEKTVVIKRNDFSKPILVALELDNLRLNEVVIAAQKGKSFSEITLGKEAVNQVQAFSLSEVLEQLPGQAVTPFNLSEFKPIAFRTTKPTIVANAAFGNKSFGTAVVVDGIPISNNENMQSYGGNSGAPFSPNFLGFGDNTQGFNGYFSNANYGADLREISTENIEKIEVVQGVPSAKYGDLTSGLIKIQQKAGQSPYKIYTSLRDGASEYGLAKGFYLGEKAGALNVGLNYLESNTSPRTSFTSYERINTNLMWSWNNKSKSIRNSFSVNYGFNNDNVNYEEEDTDDKIVKNQKKDLSIANRFKWNFSESSFLDGLESNFSFNYSDHFTFESKFVNIGGTIVGTSTEEGVYTGVYTPVSYTTVKAIEGIPIASFFGTDVFKTIYKGNWTHSISSGISFRMSDNKGRGRLGSPETLVSAFTNSNGDGSQGFRPYNYGENVRAEYQFSLYAEDNISRTTEKNSFVLNTGLRYDYQYGFSNLAPRINTYFNQNNYKVRAGFGLTSKAPSLNQIYTGPRYYDAVLGDYRLPGFYNLGIVQTFIDYADNKNLEPSKSLRSEVGFDYKFPFAEINITGFYNHLYNGITNEALPTTREIAQLDITFNGNQTPTYTVSGYSPYYFTQNRLVNKYLSTDKGIEFFVNIPKLPIRNLKLDIQGSYIETKNRNDVDSFFRSTDTSKPEIFGVYKAYDEYFKQFQISTNINYHLPKIGLVIAVRSEHFIIDENNFQNFNLPYAYLDANLSKVAIPEADQNNTALYGHIIRSQSEFNRELTKAYHNFHLRVSKDFLNGFRFSFYANNFLDLKTTNSEIVNGSNITRINSRLVPLSFGTKIEYQF